MATADNMGPDHVPQHGPQTRPTTCAPNTSHNMGPEHVPQHGPRIRPTTISVAKKKPKWGARLLKNPSKNDSTHNVESEAVSSVR